MSIRIQTRLAIATAFAAAILLPLKANADPEGLFQPARCGQNTAVDIIQVGIALPEIFKNSRYIYALANGNNSNVERRVGYELVIKALVTPGRPGGGAFEKAVINFRAPNNSLRSPLRPEDLVAHFHFRKAGLVKRTFKELGLTQINRGKWQKVVVTDAQLVTNDLLQRMVVFLSNSSNNSGFEVHFGNAEVVHKNQGGIDSRLLLTIGDCEDLDR